jgi:predicted methyltransferase
LRHQRFIAISVVVAVAAIAGVCAKVAAIQRLSAVPQSQIPQYIRAAVNSPARPPADRQLDASRKPEQLLAFFGIKPGMRVADLWAGGGYTTELLARTVGPSGKVYSQNMEFPPRFKKASEMWLARLKEPGMANVVEITKPFDASDLLPVPPGSLDAVIINMNYHDMVGRGFNRDNVNHAVFTALKPGGIYGLVDNSAKPGTGASDANTLHRIDENFEVSEIEKAGFRLAATSDVLRNPNDPRTQPFWKINHTQDRFVLKFVKR